MKIKVVKRESDNKFAIKILKYKFLFCIPIWEWFQENHEKEVYSIFAGEKFGEAYVLEPNVPEVAIWEEDKDKLLNRFSTWYGVYKKNKKEHISYKEKNNKIVDVTEIIEMPY